jgi:hypothetical protein
MELRSSSSFKAPLGNALNSAAHKVTYGALKTLIERGRLHKRAKQAYSDVFHFVTGIKIQVGDLFRSDASSYIRAKYCHRMFQFTIPGYSMTIMRRRGGKIGLTFIIDHWRFRGVFLFFILFSPLASGSYSSCSFGVGQVCITQVLNEVVQPGDIF